MSDNKMKLDPEQKERFAKLLVNFSSETANAVLNRFDRATRNQIRSCMADLSYSGLKSDEASVSEFAEFLYFEPDEQTAAQHSSRSMQTTQTVTSPPATRQEIRKPQLSPNRHANATSARAGISFHDIVGFSDVSLESLLKAAPPELTVSVLTCSPESFVSRVLSKLSPSEAQSVRAQISQAPVVELEDMQRIHQRYCDFATHMIDNGLMNR